MVLFLALYSPSVTINAQLFQNLFFVSNYTGNGFLGHWWSLCVEEHFYLGLCLIASLAGHKLRGADPFRVRSVLILGAIAVALLKLAAAQGVTAYVYTHWQLDFFMVGMALRLSYENKKEDHHDRSRLLSLAALFGSAFLYIIAAAICAHSLSPNDVLILGHMPADFMPAASVLALIMAVTFVWSFGFDGSWLSRLCSLRPLRWIAGISYSMYLVHLFVLNYPIFSKTDPRVLISWISPHQRFYLVRAIPIEITATIAVSIVYFVICERPMLRLRRHLSR
jgi:peptidoglycan/LPS O-acetylase OafA/YrhL